MSDFDLAAQLREAVATLNVDVDLLHQIVQGDDTTEVPTEGGLVKSMAKAIKDLEDYYINTDILAQSIAARDAAQGYANNASGSAGDANTYRGQALTYRNEAQGFRNEAQGFRTEAQTARNEAVPAATTATTQAGVATTAAGTATTQAGIATTKAGEALASEQNAAASESNAADSADAAALSEAAAAGFAAATNTQMNGLTPFYMAPYKEASVAGDAYANSGVESNRNYVITENSQITYAGLIWPQSTHLQNGGSWQYLVRCKTPVGTSASILVRLANYNAQSINVYISYDGNILSNTISANALTIGQPAHVVVRLDFLNKVLSIFVNGVEAPVNNPTLDTPAGMSMTFGVVSLGDLFQFGIATAKLFNKLLTAEEIAALYASKNAVVPTTALADLQVDYDFGGVGAGAALLDKSGNGWHTAITSSNVAGQYPARFTHVKDKIYLSFAGVDCSANLILVAMNDYLPTKGIITAVWIDGVRHELITTQNLAMRRIRIVVRDSGTTFMVQRNDGTTSQDLLSGGNVTPANLNAVDMAFEVLSVA